MLIVQEKEIQIKICGIVENIKSLLLLSGEEKSQVVRPAQNLEYCRNEWYLFYII